MKDVPSVLPSGRSRREFIKTYAQFAAYFSLCAPVSRMFVAEVEAQTANLSGLFNADLAVAPFTALQSLNGSVRGAVPNGAGITALTALTGNANPSIIITRVALTGNSQFGNLGQRCTHQGNAVSAKAAGQNTLICPLHGSQYNPATGAVVVGPAALALTSYLAVFNATPAPFGSLQITIPGIGYTFVGATVAALQGQRVRLTFPTRAGSNYQARFRNTATGTESTIAFFTTQNGASSVTSVAGSGANLSVFVTPPAGVGIYRIVANP